MTDKFVKLNMIEFEVWLPASHPAHSGEDAVRLGTFVMEILPAPGDRIEIRDELWTVTGRVFAAGGPIKVVVT